jgi:hypothetical protein
MSSFQSTDFSRFMEDISAGIGAGLQAYDPNNIFAGAGAAMSASAASRRSREAPYRKMEADMAQRQMLADMYKGKRAHVVDYGRMTEEFKDMIRQMMPKTAANGVSPFVGKAPPVDVIREELMRQAEEMGEDPEWLRRGGPQDMLPPTPRAGVEYPEGSVSEDVTILGEDPEWVRRGGVEADMADETYFEPWSSGEASARKGEPTYDADMGEDPEWVRRGGAAEEARNKDTDYAFVTIVRPEGRVKIRIPKGMEDELRRLSRMNPTDTIKDLMRKASRLVIGRPMP